MAKLKTIMRQKIRTIIDGAKPDDFDYTKVIEIPDNVDSLATYGRFLNFPRSNNRDVRRNIWNASASASGSIDRDLESFRETAPRTQKRRNTAKSQAQQDQRVAEVMLELQRRARDLGKPNHRATFRFIRDLRVFQNKRSRRVRRRRGSGRGRRQFK